MEDIVFVTGSHLTGPFCFSENRWEGQVSFGAQVSGISYVEWQFPHNFHLRCGISHLPEGQVRHRVLPRL